MSPFIQTVTVKLSNGLVGQFVGLAIVNAETPKDVTVVDVSFSPPRPAPYDVRVSDPAAPAPPKTSSP
jgi:hypothetical protein